MIKVTVTCAWCLKTVETTITAPIPKDWISKEVMDPNILTHQMLDENFCSEEHYEEYKTAAPQAHAAAAKDYTAKFYATMNELRSE